MKHYFIIIFTACLAFAVSMSASAKPLIEIGRWSAGGSASVIFSLNRRAATAVDLDLTPRVSYFVWDGVELALNASILGALANSDAAGRSKVPISWGFGGGARYYFDVGRNLFPYAGVNAGFRISNTWTGSMAYHVGLEGGLMIALTEVLAVDVNLPLRAEFTGSTFQQAVIAPTCLGVRYFF